MKKQNLFFAIVMISFTSTFMSCQKEALITQQIQSNYEIPIDNDVNQSKNNIDADMYDLGNLTIDKISENYEIKIDNEVNQLKNRIDPIPADVAYGTHKTPVKFVKDVCINGGISITAVHPTLGADYYRNSNYTLEWLYADKSSLDGKTNRITLNCVCSGIYYLQVIGKGIVIDSYKVEVKSKCSGDIPDETY